MAPQNFFTVYQVLGATGKVGGCASQNRKMTASSSENKLLVKISLAQFEKIDFENFGCQIPIFGSKFLPFLGVVAIQFQLQKVIILGVLVGSFGILEKSFTVLEILEKGYFAP